MSVINTDQRSTWPEEPKCNVCDGSGYRDVVGKFSDGNDIERVPCVVCNPCGSRKIKCGFCGKVCKLRDRQDELGKYQIALCSGCHGTAIIDDDGEYWFTDEVISAAVRQYYGMG